MKKLIHTLGALFLSFPILAPAADAPAIERPKPLTATLVGVCENRLPALMVAIFTFDNGKVLVVDAKNMQGFATAADIVRYAATAATVNEYAQKCGDVST